MKKNSAFTLIELLTVIAIIGILAAIIIPTVGAVRGKAKSISCASNMRQIGQALILYASENKQMFPYAYGYVMPGGATAPSWRVSLSPYIGLAGRIGPAPGAASDGVLLCPAFTYDPATRTSPYGYNPNIDKRNGFTSGPLWEYKANITGPSRLFLVLEVDVNAEFCYPSNYTVDGVAWGTKRRHPGNVANYVFADGHVESTGNPTTYSISNAAGSDPRWLYSLAQ